MKNLNLINPWKTIHERVSMSGKTSPWIFGAGPDFLHHLERDHLEGVRVLFESTKQKDFYANHILTREGLIAHPLSFACGLFAHNCTLYLLPYSDRWTQAEALMYAIGVANVDGTRMIFQAHPNIMKEIEQQSLFHTLMISKRKQNGLHREFLPQNKNRYIENDYDTSVDHIIHDVLSHADLDLDALFDSMFQDPDRSIPLLLPYFKGRLLEEALMQPFILQDERTIPYIKEMMKEYITPPQNMHVKTPRKI